MQAEPAGAAAVQAVARDGPAEAERVSRVHAQLVRPPRQGRETHQRFIAGQHPQQFPVRHGLLSLLEINHLPRPVVVVQHQRQRDASALCKGLPGAEPGDVGLLHLVPLELLLKDGQAVSALGEDHQPGGVHVQPVAGADVRAGARAALKALLKGDLQRAPRHRQHPGRLVRHDDVFILV